MSERTHFINPYTFVPLEKDGPLLKTKEPPNHAWFDEGTFTGILNCELDFITPALIPGKQNNKKEPGEISAYKLGDRLAIPGSRIRGQLLNLMRTINSSRIESVEDRIILDRSVNDHKKGFIFLDNERFYIQEIRDEILVTHPNRQKYPNLDNDCEPNNKPEVDQNGILEPIKPYLINSSGTKGIIFGKMTDRI